ncbi:MAG TPA: F0F1 ATP synthase subunit A [Candidatus Omnitrophota bacterium]|nr:F0F1 ATP synthase subunit A [Candidatus Omnitrophota bacterium]
MHHKELPNIVTLAAEFLPEHLSEKIISFESVIFSGLIVLALSTIAFFTFKSVQKKQGIASRLQNAMEVVVDALDGFVCSILGSHGREYVPFIGTLFIYILSMNLIGLVPFFKSPSASWSTTMALAICVFVYLQYTALKQLGIKGYTYHLLGKPKGIIAFSIIIPLLMFFLHVVAEFVRPFSLSLRLRSNIWGDEMLLGVLSGFGLQGVPLIIFNSFLSMIAGIVQALVFCLLTTIYFALALVHED